MLQVLNLVVLGTLLYLAKAHLSEDEVNEACKKQVGFNPEFISKHFAATGALPEEALCYLKCRMEKMGYLDADGNIIMETVKSEKSRLKPEKVEDVVKCLEGIKKVEVCKDVEPFRTCMAMGM